jgi:hypothetical protein
MIAPTPHTSIPKSYEAQLARTSGARYHLSQAEGGGGETKGKGGPGGDVLSHRRKRRGLGSLLGIDFGKTEVCDLNGIRAAEGEEGEEAP